MKELKEFFLNLWQGVSFILMIVMVFVVGNIFYEQARVYKVYNSIDQPMIVAKHSMTMFNRDSMYGADCLATSTGTSAYISSASPSKCYMIPRAAIASWEERTEVGKVDAKFYGTALVFFLFMSVALGAFPLVVTRGNLIGFAVLGIVMTCSIAVTAYIGYHDYQRITSTRPVWTYQNETVKVSASTSLYMVDKATRKVYVWDTAGVHSNDPNILKETKALDGYTY